ncbi:alpha/beta hydrolase [Dyella tabacisoli]|uniref:Alpha/beta hydrolase n=1 Tax=Dyella tabacisoli TaxID=2282381 RepID=A0A369UKX1_9GAMM|nr:alpha/beta hydrolase-fold protein [Dyella tabacisoli]RDD80368.1 alpha/beta hydrolase [Dyella tabacisoli]
MKERFAFPWLTACFIALSACSAAQAPVPSAQQAVKPAAPASTGYVLKNTEVRDIASATLHRDYQVFVSLPPSYEEQPTRRFPVVFVTDANYAFPLIRSIATRVGDHGSGLEEFVLVGLSYAKDETPTYSRQRDYTPTPNGPTSKDAVSDMPGRSPVYGEAEAYRKFIADEVFPFVAKNYRVDMHRKIFSGHSYGGLLGVQMLLTEPTMFERYIISSPSLWFDNKVMLARERDYAAAHKDMPADVLMMTGGYETINPASKDKRYNHTRDMVRDMQTFEAQLKSRHYPGLHIESQTIADEDHLTVYPDAITHGLLWALPPK